MASWSRSCNVLRSHAAVAAILMACPPDVAIYPAAVSMQAIRFQPLNEIRKRDMKKGFLIDMDGVIYRSSELIPGAVEFIRQPPASRDIPFLFLTNNSQRTRRDVATKLAADGHAGRGTAHLHLRDGDGPLPRQPEAARHGVRHRRRRPAQRAALRTATRSSTSRPTTSSSAKAARSASRCSSTPCR